MKCRSDDLAGRVRRMVSAQEAALQYGFTPNRTGYICCPFHGEKTPSLKFFEDGGFYCFGCHKGGSAIDFVMELFGLDFRQAVVRLDLDFSLGLTGGGRSAPAPDARVLAQRRAEQARRAALEAEIGVLTEENFRLHQNRQLYAPCGLHTDTVFHPLFAQALQRLPEVQWRLEELENELKELEHGKNRDPGISS